MMTLLILLLIASLAALALWPEKGIVARWQRARQLTVRTRQEDALKHILKAEANDRPASVASIAGSLRIREEAAAALLAQLEQGGLVTFEGGAPRLRPAGRELAHHVVRAHRLWESFLADQTGVAEADWHRQAERHEHLLSPEETDRLAARLGNPLRDPHGDSIPAVGEAVSADPGQPLTDLAVGQHFEVTHIEDEPENVYRQLLALGIRTRLQARLAARSTDFVDLRIAGNRVVRLTCLQANNLTVSSPQAELDESVLTLSELELGCEASVIGLSAACRGAARRRLLDLGFVPGTLVSVELASPLGDPTAYRVRGSIVALRRNQAGLIRVRTKGEVAA